MLAKKTLWLGLISLLLLAFSGCSSQSQDPAALSVGDAAPDFTLTNTDGSAYTLSDHLGENPVLLFFHMADG